MLQWSEVSITRYCCDTIIVQTLENDEMNAVRKGIGKMTNTVIYRSLGSDDWRVVKVGTVNDWFDIAAC